jgi:glyoxylase I family protein
MQRMAIKLENVGIAVRDLEATISFFTDLGLTVVGRDTVSGEWTDTAVGLDGNHANIAMLETPDGHGRLELFEYIHPEAIESEPTRPNEIGMHRVAFSVDDIDEALEIAAKHGCHPLRGVAEEELTAEQPLVLSVRALPEHWRMCVLTVASLMNASRAISALLSPRAARA